MIIRRGDPLDDTGFGAMEDFSEDTGIDDLDLDEDEE